MLSANGGQINTAIRSSHAFTHKNKRYCLITIREPSSPFPLISSMAYTGNEIKLVYLHDNGDRIHTVSEELDQLRDARNTY
jgi:hypothetical protein